jgi:hypothetical protein
MQNLLRKYKTMGLICAEVVNKKSVKTGHDHLIQIITIIHDHLPILFYATASFNYLSLHLPIKDDNVKFMTADVQARHSDAAAPPAVDATSIKLCHSRNSPTHKIELHKPLLRNDEPSLVTSGTWATGDRQLEAKTFSGSYCLIA